MVTARIPRWQEEASDAGRRPLRLGLRVGARYRVDGVLHEYAGEAHLPESSLAVHVFLRREWPVNDPDRLPVTLLSDTDVSSRIRPAGGAVYPYRKELASRRLAPDTLPR